MLELGYFSSSQPATHRSDITSLQDFSYFSLHHHHPPSFSSILNSIAPRLSPHSWSTVISVLNIHHISRDVHSNPQLRSYFRRPQPEEHKAPPLPYSSIPIYSSRVINILFPVQPRWPSIPSPFTSITTSSPTASAKRASTKVPFSETTVVRPAPVPTRPAVRRKPPVRTILSTSLPAATETSLKTFR